MVGSINMRITVHIDWDVNGRPYSKKYLKASRHWWFTPTVLATLGGRDQEDRYLKPSLDK
jgi:hypothetical protein